MSYSECTERSLYLHYTLEISPFRFASVEMGCRIFSLSLLWNIFHLDRTQWAERSQALRFTEDFSASVEMDRDFPPSSSLSSQKSLELLRLVFRIRLRLILAHNITFCLDLGFCPLESPVPFSLSCFASFTQELFVLSELLRFLRLVLRIRLRLISQMKNPLDFPPKSSGLLMIRMSIYNSKCSVDLLY